jgi:hypothetical protein
LFVCLFVCFTFNSQSNVSLLVVSFFIV